MKKLNLPALPPVPTAPMPPAARRSLAELLATRLDLTDPDVQAWERQGYARIWLHLLLDRHLDPRMAISPKQPAYQAVLRPFQAAGVRIGRHDACSMAWLAPAVAREAYDLWRHTTAVQGEAPKPLPMPGLDSLSSAQPAWLRRSLLFLLFLLPCGLHAAPQLLVASYYGHRFQGRPMANKAPFNFNRLTCAHRTFPLGTRLRLSLGEQAVIVTVTDRGPRIADRDLDLSLAAAKALGMTHYGLAVVEVEVL
jgi:hypothetical protein